MSERSEPPRVRIFSEIRTLTGPDRVRGFLAPLPGCVTKLDSPTPGVAMFHPGPVSWNASGMRKMSKLQCTPPACNGGHRLSMTAATTEPFSRSAV